MTVWNYKAVTGKIFVTVVTAPYFCLRQEA